MLVSFVFLLGISLSTYSNNWERDVCSFCTYTLLWCEMCVFYLYKKTIWNYLFHNIWKPCIMLEAKLELNISFDHMVWNFILFHFVLYELCETDVIDIVSEAINEINFCMIFRKPPAWNKLTSCTLHNSMKKFPQLAHYPYHSNLIPIVVSEFYHHKR